MIWIGWLTTPFTDAGVTEPSTTPPLPEIVPVASRLPFTVSVEFNVNTALGASVSALIVVTELMLGRLVMNGTTTESVLNGTPTGDQLVVVVHRVFVAPVHVRKPTTIPVAVNTAGDPARLALVAVAVCAPASPPRVQTLVA